MQAPSGSYSDSAARAVSRQQACAWTSFAGHKVFFSSESGSVGKRTSPCRRWLMPLSWAFEWLGGWANTKGKFSQVNSSFLHSHSFSRTEHRNRLRWLAISYRLSNLNMLLSDISWKLESNTTIIGIRAFMPTLMGLLTSHHKLVSKEKFNNGRVGSLCSSKSSPRSLLQYADLRPLCTWWGKQSTTRLQCDRIWTGMKTKSLFNSFLSIFNCGMASVSIV